MTLTFDLTSFFFWSWRTFADPLWRLDFCLNITDSSCLIARNRSLREHFIVVICAVQQLLTDDDAIVVLILWHRPRDEFRYNPRFSLREDLTTRTSRNVVIFHDFSNSPMEWLLSHERRQLPSMGVLNEDWIIINRRHPTILNTSKPVITLGTPQKLIIIFIVLWVSVKDLPSSTQHLIISRLKNRKTLVFIIRAQ